MTDSAPDSHFAPAIALTGDFQFARGQRIVQPQCQSRMLVWCKAGRGRVLVNGQALPLEPKDAVFLPWNRELIYEADARAPFLVGGMHLIPRHDRREPLRFYVPHSPRDRFTDVPFRQDGPLAELDGIRAARFGLADPFELFAEYLVAKFRQESVGAQGPAADPAVAAESYTLAPVFLREAARCFARGESGAAGMGAGDDVGGSGGALPPDLIRLLRFIENHMGEAVSLSDLARFSGLSRSNIGRLFRRHLKTTPVAWITRVKLEHAKRLLAAGSMPIGRVGAAVGIADPFYFSKLFKKTTGLSAKAYRRSASLV